MRGKKNKFWISLLFLLFSCDEGPSQIGQPASVCDRAKKRISECVGGEVHIVSCRGGGYAENILLAKDCEEVLNLIQGG